MLDNLTMSFVEMNKIIRKLLLLNNFLYEILIYSHVYKFSV